MSKYKASKDDVNQSVQVKISAVDSHYSDDYTDDLSSEGGAGSISPFEPVLDELEREGGKATRAHQLAGVRPTLLQTIGASKIYLLPQQNNNSSKKLNLTCLLLVFAVIVGGIVGFSVTFFVDTPKFPAGASSTRSPTVSFQTQSPSKLPTRSPVTPAPTVIGQTHFPTNSPSRFPTPAPTTPNPTPAPTKAPSPSPTKAPTPSPSASPTPSPTKFPTPSPTKEPTRPPSSSSPTVFPTNAPTKAPNPCSTAPNANYRFCASNVILQDCVLSNGLLVPGASKVCTGDRPFCRCALGVPFDISYGCVRADNVGKDCPSGF